MIEMLNIDKLVVMFDDDMEKNYKREINLNTKKLNSGKGTK